MDVINFKLGLIAPQIAIFSPPNLNNPFNSWEDDHIAQGFSWRPQSVSFSTLEEYGELTVEVQIVQSFQLREDALRIIRVPFHVAEEGTVVISNLAEERKISVPSGDYGLTFETGYLVDRAAICDGAPTWSRFTFTSSLAHHEAEVIRADYALSPPSQLLMRAEPAVH